VGSGKKVGSLSARFVLEEETLMKKLIAILVIVSAVLLNGCTVLTYYGKDGRSITYMSTKEFKSLDVEINKDGNKVDVKVNAKGVTSDLVEEIANGVEKGLKAASGAGAAEGIIKSRGRE